MKLRFTKMQGTGNDFIMLNALEGLEVDYSKLAEKLCDRHFGIGGDGIILILPGDDFRMRIFNSDGSEAEMCGNGIRCFAHYLKREKLTERDTIKVETLAGIITPEIVDFTPRESRVRVNLGQPRFNPGQIPVITEDEKIRDTGYLKDYNLQAAGNNFPISCVSMGNPHAVIFREKIEEVPLENWGKAIENHPLFPEKTNVEFIEIINPEEIKMRVWERGAGITLACGTGAAASVVAGIKNGYLKEKVTVHLPGGELVIEWSGDDVYMTGPAATVFEGTITIDNLF